MMKIDKSKTYLDVTNENAAHPDDRGVAKITWDPTLECWTPDLYDYTLTDAELAEGLADGWIRAA